MKITIIIAIVFFLCGCGKEQPTAPEIKIVNIAGSWSGVGKSHRGTPMTLEFEVYNISNVIKGNGSVQLSGSLAKNYYVVDGTIDGDQVKMNFWGDSWYVEFSGWVGQHVMMGQLSGLGATDGKISFVRK
jgi:hypothetical protein